MRLTNKLLVATLLTAGSASNLLSAAQTNTSWRWLNADQVRVRTGPGTEHAVSATLLLGAKLKLIQKDPQKDFCLIDGDGASGYVACQYLSEREIARARSGENGIPTTQRWAAGSALIVRTAPSQNAAVLSQLHLNSVVNLVNENAGNGYCEIQTTSLTSGFTACRYLATTPVILAHIRGEVSTNEPMPKEYNPERAFWISPGWWELEAYVNTIKDEKKKADPTNPWPRDQALEKMKAHLALGIYGSKPPALIDWGELKRKVAQQRELWQNRKSSQAQQQQLDALIAESETALGISSPPHSAYPAEVERSDLLRLINQLEFASISPSLFRNESELAPGHEQIEQISARFGIVYRTLVSPRPATKSEDAEYSNAGLYDMLNRTRVLARQVQQIRLYRDGKITQTASQLRITETLWREVEEPMCEGWIPGFSFGDAENSIWSYFNDSGTSASEGKSMQKESRKYKPKDSLYYFYVPGLLNVSQAHVSQASMTLHRQQTGFVGGQHWYFDLNQDGISDIAIWEGRSKGPGHLGGTTETDDLWYRLVLVNLNGAWKILGRDQFSYGCGC